MVKGVGVDGGKVAIDIVLGYPAQTFVDALAQQVRAKLAAAGMADATVGVTSRVFAHKVQKDLTPMPNVKNIIAVASGKGGVGKFHDRGESRPRARRGRCECWRARRGYLRPPCRACSACPASPTSKDGQRIEPKLCARPAGNVDGLHDRRGQAVIWRGPMVTQALTQLLNDTNWDDSGLPRHRPAARHRRHQLTLASACRCPARSS